MSEAKLIAEAEAAPLSTEIDQLTRGIQLWAEANREKLTDGYRRKTVALAAGELLWRIRPPSVRVTGEADVIAYLRTAEMDEFLRVRTIAEVTVNTDVILANLNETRK